jgi:polyphosphate glucokinase
MKNKPMRMKNAISDERLHTLAVDIGGTGLKASVLDRAGKMLVDEVRVATPNPCPPKVLLGSLVELIGGLPEYRRVSVGFPGAVRDGKVLTAPHFGNKVWAGFPLADALSKRLGKPVRLLNDADVQGLGIIKGKGLEVVLTLGTGAGTAVFRHGKLMPHLELGQHPIHHDLTYDEYIGDAARKRKGKKKWNRRVAMAIKQLRILFNYDVLYIGGGNSPDVVNPPDDVVLVSNLAGITGGIKLWDLDAGKD